MKAQTLGRILARRHLHVPRAVGRTIGEHFEVTGDIGARFEGSGSHRFTALDHDPLQQVQVGGDALGARIRVIGTDRLIPLAAQFAIVLSQLLDDVIVHDGEHRRDAVPRDPGRGVQSEPDPQNGDVK